MPLPQVAIIIGISVIAGGLSISILGAGKGIGGMDFLVALVGAYLMDWISRVMSFPIIIPIIYENVQYEVIWATIGAFLFIFLLRFASDSTM